MLFDANNSKSSEAGTVDCSVFSLAQCHATAKVSNDEAEKDIMMAEIRSRAEYDARRHCRELVSRRKRPIDLDHNILLLKGLLSDFVATWINI